MPQFSKAQRPAQSAPAPAMVRTSRTALPVRTVRRLKTSPRILSMALYRAFTFALPVVLPLLLARPALANPQGAQVVQGSATIQTQGNRLNVTNSAGAVINWQSFSIKAGEQTHFQQPNASSAVLNRVISNNPSEIFGNLTSNGRVVLVNQGGITIGKGAAVDTAGFTASALGMTDADWAAGRMRFQGNALSGNVQVDGSIRSANGDIVLLAPNVATGKDALLRAENGSVIVGAGQQVELTGRGLEGVKFIVQAADNKATNLGTLQGNAVGMFGGTLRHSGVIQAQTASLEGGRVVLRALKDIEITAGAKIVADGGVAAIAAAAGDSSASKALLAGVSAGGGAIQIIAEQGRVSVEQGALISANGSPAGSIRIFGAQGANIAGVLSAASPARFNANDPGSIVLLGGPAGSAQVGGRIEVLGSSVTLASGALLDASGDAGGGTILVGGDYQGKNPDIVNAFNTTVEAGAVLSANARVAGDGGKVIVWADNDTNFSGTLQAKGGEQGGNGGFGETSGKHHLYFRGRADLGARRGRQGDLLLDPDDIVIVGGSGSQLEDASFAAENGNIILFTSPATFTISEAALEGISGNVLLEATRSIRVSGIFDDNTLTFAGGVTLRTRNQSGLDPILASGYAIDMVTGGGQAIAIRAQGNVVISSGTAGSLSYLAPVRVGSVFADSASSTIAISASDTIAIGSGSAVNTLSAGSAAANAINFSSTNGPNAVFIANATEFIGDTSTNGGINPTSWRFGVGAMGVSHNFSSGLSVGGTMDFSSAGSVATLSVGSGGISAASLTVAGGSGFNLAAGNFTLGTGGATTINGTVDIAAGTTFSSFNNDLIIGAGGIFGGSGTLNLVNKDLIVSGGTLAPGGLNYVGTLTVSTTGTVNLASGKLFIDATSPSNYDQLAFIGNTGVVTLGVGSVSILEPSTPFTTLGMAFNILTGFGAVFSNGSGVPFASTSAVYTGNTTATAYQAVVSEINNQWTNAAGGLWSLGTNWSRGTAPTASQNAIIDMGVFNPIVTITAGANARSLVLAEHLIDNNVLTLDVGGMTVNNGGRLDMPGSASTLLSSGNIVFNSGSTLSLSGGSIGAAIDAGALSLLTDNGSTVTIAGTGNTFVNVYRNWNNNGTINWAGGIATQLGANAGGDVTLTNLGSGIINLNRTVSAGNDAFIGGTAGYLINKATITSKSGVGLPTVLNDSNVTMLNQDGSIAVNNNTLQVNGSSSGLTPDTGIYNVDGGATLNFSGSGRTLSSAASIAGAGTFVNSNGNNTIQGLLGIAIAGTVQITGGNLSLTNAGGPLTFNNKLSITGGTFNTGASNVQIINGLELTAGTFTGTGNIDITGGAFDWSGGTVSTSGAGTLGTASGTNTNITGAATANLARNWENKGIVSHTGTGKLAVSGSKTIFNRLGATFSDSSGNSAAISLGTGTFNNEGTLNWNKSGGIAGTLGTFINQTGGVLNLSGNQTLNLAPTVGTFTQAGTLNVGNNSIFQRVNGFTNTGLIVGEGTVSVGLGTLTNDGTIAPGSSSGLGLGTLTIAGNFVQGSGGTLAVGKSSAGTDKLVITGTNVTFGGTLSVSALPGYSFAVGDSIQFVEASNAGSILQTFDVFNFSPTLSGLSTAGGYVGGYTQGFTASIPGTSFWDGGGGADTSWSNKLNWSGDVLPTLGSTVTVNPGGALAGTVTLGGYTVPSFFSLSFPDPQDNFIINNAGVITTPAGTTMSARVTVNTGGTLALGGSLAMATGLNLNGGVVDLANYSAALTFSNGSTSNFTSGSFTQSVLGFGGITIDAGAIVNTINGGGVQYGANLTNNGQFNVSGGNAVFGKSVTNNGQINVNTGQASFDSGASLTNTSSGQIIINGGLFRMPSGITNLGGTVVLAGGTIEGASKGSGAFDSLSWQSGEFNGAGNYTVTTLAMAKGGTTGNRRLGGAVTIVSANNTTLSDGTLALSNTAILSINSGSQLTVAAAGTLEIDGGLLNAGTLVNDGLVRITANASNTTTKLSVLGTTNGDYEIAAGRTLNFDANNLTLGNASSITGGTWEIATNNNVTITAGTNIGRGNGATTRLSGGTLTIDANGSLTTPFLVLTGATPVLGGGDLTVTQGFTQIGGNLGTSLRNVSLRQASGNLDVAGFSTTSLGSISLAADAGSVSTTSPLTTGALSLQALGDITVTAKTKQVGATSVSGDINLALIGPSLLDGLFTASGKTASVSISGNLGQTLKAIDTQGAVILNMGANAVDLTKAGNKIAQGLKINGAGAAKVAFDTTSSQTYAVAGIMSSLVLTGNAVQLGSASLGTLSTTSTGGLEVNAKSISQGAALSVAGASTLTATGGDIDMGIASVYGGGVALNGNKNVRINSVGLLNVQGLANGDVALTATGNVTQAAALTVGGTLSIAAASQAITLMNKANDFNAVTFNASTLEIKDKNAIAVGGKASTWVKIEAGGNISTAGLLTTPDLQVIATSAGTNVSMNVNASGNSKFLQLLGAGYNNINYSNQASTGQLSSIYATGAVVLTQNGDFVLPQVIAASLNATANGNITQTGAIDTGGLVSLKATGNITLNDTDGVLFGGATNSFGPSGLRFDAGGDVMVTSAGSLRAGGVANNVQLMASGALVIVSDLKVGQAMETATNGQLVLQADTIDVQANVVGKDLTVTSLAGALTVGGAAGTSAARLHATRTANLQGKSIALLGGLGNGSSAEISSDGTLQVNTTGNVTLAGGSGAGSSASVNARGAVDVKYGGTLALLGGSGAGAYARLDPAAGAALTLTGGALNVTGGSGAGAYAALVSDGDIRINTSSLSLIAGSGLDADAVVISAQGVVGLPAACNGCVVLTANPLGNLITQTGVLDRLSRVAVVEVPVIPGNGANDLLQIVTLLDGLVHPEPTGVPKPKGDGVVVEVACP